MKNHLFVIVIVLTLSSCWPGFILFNTKKEAKEKSTVKYTGKGTNIEHRINIYGFYTPDDGRALIPDNDSIFRHCIMFLNDGTVIEFYLSQNEKYKTEDDIKNNLYTYVFNRDIKISMKGIYKVDKGKINANMFFLNQYYWCVLNRECKIIDKEHLKVYDIIYNNQIITDKYVFYPVNENQDHLEMQHVIRKLKKQKWLWENESDWKKWKRKQKELWKNRRDKE